MKNESNSHPSQPSPDFPFTPAPNESAEAFQAFCAYFKMTGKRYMTTLAEQAGVDVRTIRRWAKAFDWEGRLNRHRASLLKASAQLQAEEQRQESLDWGSRCAEIRELEWEISRELFRAIKRRLQSDVLDQATLADLARSFGIASRIARLAGGLPNTPPDENNSENEHHDAEFRRAMEMALAQAARNPPPSAPMV